MSVPSALPMQTRLAPIGKVDVESRTINVVWTTGATVRRVRYEGWDTMIPFDEELLVSEDAIDFTRLQAGAPVLDNHWTYSTDAIRAVVDRAWLEGGEGLATFRFPREGVRKASDELFDLARDKIIRNVSVGYFINRVRVVEPEKRGDVERRIIERWQPYEISFVTVPADAGAQVRSADAPRAPLEIVGHGLALSAARSRMAMRARAAGL